MQQGCRPRLASSSSLSPAEQAFFAFLGDLTLGSYQAPHLTSEAVPQFLEHCYYHGLFPPSHGSVASQASPTPQQDPFEPIRRACLVQLARNVNALHQLEELANAFSKEGIPVIALKGAAAILWLYDDIACRQISDLDILVDRKHIDQAADLMYDLGYEHDERSVRRSREEELIAYRHLRPFKRQGSFIVEMHTNILRYNGSVSITPRELFDASVQTKPESPYLRRLSAPHFLLHTAIHHCRHLLTGIPPLKFLVDMALAVRKVPSEIDWDEFWRTADRWGIRYSTAVIMATLEHHWQLGIPGIPSDATPLSGEALLHGAVPIAGREIVSTISSEFEWSPGHPTAIPTRLSWAWELPDPLSRVRYILGIFLPARAYIRHQYNVPEGRSLAPYYVAYLSELLWRFVAGLASALRRSIRRRR